MSVDIEKTYGPGEITVPEMLAWVRSQTGVLSDTDLGDALVAVLEREQRWQFAVKACMEMYEEDPEYAEEWPALHHLKHVRDGEANPDCDFCTIEGDEQARATFMAPRRPKMADRG